MLRARPVAGLPGEEEMAGERKRAGKDDARRRGRGSSCGLFVATAIFMSISLPELGQADTTLETDTEVLAQMFFALGGPSWYRRGGWERIEMARDQFDDVFDVDGDEVLTPEEIKRGLNVNYVGCAYPPCNPTMKVQNPLFSIPLPDEPRSALEEFGFKDEYIQPFIENALRTRIDPVRGADKVNGRDTSIDGLMLFKEFFSNFIAADPCNDEWHGIACSEQGRVTGVALPSNHLVGTIPPDVGNLTHLKGLLLGAADTVTRNYIIGEIPSNIDELYRLETLVLDNNLLSGTIPAGIGSLERLSVLDLSNNHLEGPLPELALLQNLQKLLLANNDLNGTLDTCANLASLDTIDCRNNDFSGDLQAPLSQLGVLRKVFLRGNNANSSMSPLGASVHGEGMISAGGAMLSQDKSALLDLWQQAGGPGWFIKTGWEDLNTDPCLSYWFGVFCDDKGRLTDLVLTRNNVSGVIPRSIKQLSMLKGIRLSENRLRGTIPAEIGGLSHLRTLHLSSNLLDGRIPASLGALKELEDVDLSDNYLYGDLPQVLEEGGLSRLLNLRLGMNRLTGTLPTTLPSMRALRILDVTDNRLRGTLVEDVWTIPGLTEIRMGLNNLEGTLPKAWGKLERVRTLDLFSNQFTGGIPEDWGGNMKQLRFLNLAGNALSGPIPSPLFESPRLEQVNLGSNYLQGKVPQTLPLVADTLTVLSLGNNNLTGPMPSSIAMLPRLSELDLSNNSFYGFLPQFFNSSPVLSSIEVKLGGNDLACPIPHFPAAASATCRTRNCPLDWVSDGKSCFKCRPGYYRDSRGVACNRCPSSVLQEEHPRYGIITDRACAVFRRDLKGGIPASTRRESDAFSVKCIPCRIAEIEGLEIVAEEGASDLKVGRGYSISSGVGQLRYNGTTVYADGTMYTGEWLDGSPHGRGVMTLPEGIYVGGFRYGKKTGQGTFTASAGDELSGEWGDTGDFFPDTGSLWSGVLSGKGFGRYAANAAVALRALQSGMMTVEQVGTAGGTYEGEWVDGEWHGYGSFAYANGDVYAGEFFRGYRHGLGWQEYADGGFYKGGWSFGQRAGNGTMFYANGDIYEGGWHDNFREGWGLFWGWDGTLYEGYWEFGTKKGWGRETQQREGTVYIGAWAEGEKNGFGQIHYGNGDSYHGYFVDGARQGDGVMHFGDVTAQDTGFNLKAGFMFGEPRSDLNPILDPTAAVPDPDVSFSVPRQFDEDYDDNLQYWGRDNTNYLVGEGYLGAGRRRR